MTNENKKETIIFYHKNCIDGSASKAVMQYFLGTDIICVPLSYGDKLPDCTDKNVYFVDFSVSVEQLMNLGTENFLLIDHHKTFLDELDKIANDPTKGKEAEFVLQNKNRFFINLNACGAKLCWQVMSKNAAIPPILEIVDANDRGIKIPFGHEFALACKYFLADNFEAWKLCLDGTVPMQRLQDIGFAMKAMDEEQKRIVLQEAHSIYFFSEKEDRFIPGLAINATNNLFKTNIANELAKQSKTFGCVYQIMEDKKVKVSLRGNEENGVNVREIAEYYAGGGHDYAASFTISIAELEVYFNR